MKLNVLLCAREIMTDMVSMSTSIIGLIDEVALSGFPTLLPQLTLFALFERSMRESENPKVKVEIASADKEIFSRIIPLDFGGKGRLRQAWNFQGFPIEKPGVITFTIKHRAKIIGVYRLTSSQLGPIQPQQPPGPVDSSTNAAEVNKKSGKRAR